MAKPVNVITAASFSFDEIVKARLKYIAAHKNRFVEAWIAETGLLPSESVLVQQEKDGVIRFWVEKKP